MRRAHEHLAAALTESLRRIGISAPRVTLEKPRDASHGDVATNVAMVHTKEARRPPRALAEEILASLDLDREIIASESVAGPGFINFVFAATYLRSIARDAIGDPKHFGDAGDLKDKRIHIEFVSANPSGPLNVVSARAAAVGDSLARMFRTRGAGCDTEYYVNDAGNQVRLLGESVRARYETALGFPTDIPEGGYHGEYLASLAQEIAEKEGDRYHRLIADEAAQQMGAVAVRFFVDSHRRTLADFRVDFQRWYYEHELRDAGAEMKALEALTEKGAIYQKDGASYLATSQYGDTQDWVVLTSDGRATYFLPDIAYHLDKFARGYDHVLNILGPDHHSFTARMKAALKALECEADKLEVILLQHVTLVRNGEPVKMSKRAGQIIEMRELIDEVGVDAARYFFLLRRTSTPLEFDIELAKKQSDENPVFYVQYAHARIESIFKKGGVPYPTQDADLNPLKEPEEMDLLRRLRELQDVIEETTQSRDPHGITVWLRDVATQFHKFYHECRVLTDPPELQSARLSLCRATQIALQKGLWLCGVNAPKEMHRIEEDS